MFCSDIVFLFDFDGILVDSVYQYVLVWKEVLDVEGVELLVWCIYCKIGMSGGLFVNMLLCEIVLDIIEDWLEWLCCWYVEVFNCQYM